MILLGSVSLNEVVTALLEQANIILNSYFNLLN